MKRTPPRLPQALHVQALSALERARILMEAKGRHAADVAKDVELAAVEAERVLADAAELDVALRVRRGRAGGAAPCIARGLRCVLTPEPFTYLLPPFHNNNNTNTNTKKKTETRIRGAPAATGGRRRPPGPRIRPPRAESRRGRPRRIRGGAPAAARDAGSCGKGRGGGCGGCGSAAGGDRGAAEGGGFQDCCVLGGGALVCGLVLVELVSVV